MTKSTTLREAASRYSEAVAKVTGTEYKYGADYTAVIETRSAVTNASRIDGVDDRQARIAGYDAGRLVAEAILEARG